MRKALEAEEEFGHHPEALETILGCWLCLESGGRCYTWIGWRGLTGGRGIMHGTGTTQKPPRCECRGRGRGSQGTP